MKTWIARDVMNVMDTIAPPRYAMQGDVIGLQVGRTSRPVQKVALALDASPESIQKAIQANADMLVTHHAMLYRPVSRVDTDSWRGQAMRDALVNDLTVFSAHTNLDIAQGGVNDVLASIAGLKDVEILEVTGRDELVKLVVYVPSEFADAVRDAICAAGCGHIGKYSHCTFNTAGVGTFLPHEGAKPTIGTVGDVERVDEVRIETIIPSPLITTVVTVMLEAHPYEEVAYDLYPLTNAGQPYGIGRIGNLESNMTLREYAAFVRDRLGLKHIRYGGNDDLVVQRVAVLGGAGGKWVPHAHRKGAQVLLTSDCDHHTVADAWADGVAVIDATHSAIERPALCALRDRLLMETHSEIDIVILDHNEDPFTWI